MREKDETAEPGRDSRVLSPNLSREKFYVETEALLNALRKWLVDLEDNGVLETVTATRNEFPEIDLHAVVSELSALRGEIGVESRGVKVSREKMEEAAETFKEGLENTREEVRSSSAGVETALTQVSSLVRERDRLRDELKETQDQPLSRGVEALMDALDTLQRGRRASDDVHRRLGWRSWLLPRGLFGALLEGHDMALQRIERTLNDLGISEIPCHGSALDPANMRVVETEGRADLPPGTVLGVVRRGYRHGDKILRVAEVRASVESKTGESPAEEAPAPQEGNEISDDSVEKREVE